MAASAKPDVAPFEPGEFQAIVELCIRAGQADTPAVVHPDARSDAPDNPFFRAATALRRALEGDTHAFESAMTRFAALMALYTGGVLGSWVRASERRPGTSDIHPAVIHVAARMKPSRNGKFPVRKFLAEVARTAADRYPDPDGWNSGASTGQAEHHGAPVPDRAS